MKAGECQPQTSGQSSLHTSHEKTEVTDATDASLQTQGHEVSQEGEAHVH